jgi:hypothetical protein
MVTVSLPEGLQRKRRPQGHHRAQGEDGEEGGGVGARALLCVVPALRLLMSALAAGRSISLPALSAGSAKLAARGTGAYARIREQFGVPIARFEGVQDRLARSRLAGDPPDITINPQVAHVGLVEFHRARELIDLGEEAMEAAIPTVRDALSFLQ